MRTTLWVTVVAAILLASTPCLWAQADHLVINEVYVNAPGSVEGAFEWFELYNQTPDDIDLTGWKICDNMDSVGEPFPAYTLVSGEYVVFCGQVDSFHVLFPGIPATSWSDPNIGNGMGNSSDMLALVNSSGQLVDRVNWGTGTWTQPGYAKWGYWNPGAAVPSEGSSVGRSPNGIDTDLPADWSTFSSPTPSVANTGAAVYTPHTIYEIQNGGNLTDSAVSVVGIVTSAKWVDASGGSIADAPGPWHGVTIYGAFTVNRGDSVEIKGTVAEFQGKTEIVPALVTIHGTATVPAITDVSLADIKTGSGTAESYEGVLVRIPKSLMCDTVPTFGEWKVCNGPDTLVIDNTSNPNGIYYAKPAIGDSVVVTGIMNYTQSEFKLMPRDSQDVVNYGPNGVAGQPQVLAPRFRQMSCQPNPAAIRSIVSFSLGTAGPVKLSVFNILGQQVATLSNGYRSAGDYRMTWDLRDGRGNLVPNGIYFVKLDAAGQSLTRRATVLR